MLNCSMDQLVAHLPLLHRQLHQDQGQLRMDPSRIQTSQDPLLPFPWQSWRPEQTPDST